MLFTIADIDAHVPWQLTTAGILKKSASAVLTEQRESCSLDTNFDAFLSHSYQDAMIDLERMFGVQELLKQYGFSSYVDWVVDKQLEREDINDTTAETLRTRMDHCKFLLFVTSENSSESKWMPWELGYMDGKKDLVATLPISQTGGTGFAGQEYLGIYPYLDHYSDTLWLNKPKPKYGICTIKQWLDGNRPWKGEK
jgi:hypothetical protein